MMTSRSSRFVCPVYWAKRSGVSGQFPVPVLLQRKQLTIDERVHRVDEDRPYPAALRHVAQHRVDDRQQVRQALARPGARRDNIRLAPLRGVECFPLMLVQAHFRAEEPRRLRQQDTLP